MSDNRYREPNIRLGKIYTKGGDGGETSLVNGRRVPKDDLKIETYGTVDELNAFVGQARLTASEDPATERLEKILLRVQHELFNAGSILATDPDVVGRRQPRVAEADVLRLEADIDELNAGLPSLNSFTLPGGCRLNCDLHVCRTVCRRAERLATALARREDVPKDVLRYLNRLSDAFFVWGRWACRALGAPETLWDPNLAASAAEAKG